MPIVLECQHCGTIFIGKHGQRFCGRACQVAAYNVLRVHLRKEESDELAAARKAMKVVPDANPSLETLDDIPMETEFLNAGLDPLPVGVEPSK